ncbi:hypothetical protein CDAR_598451 [Caerostris darwini]|uniref:Uncharacterized protein n=1 Tax=Caerostris darwini TaxID=1538125 RepID=A0AAV4QIW7_9ARAC|nr:hypothetical protein CDAR_598451 [Caerostris darwini]
MFPVYPAAQTRAMNIVWEGVTWKMPPFNTPPDKGSLLLDQQVALVGVEGDQWRAESLGEIRKGVFYEEKTAKLLATQGFGIHQKEAQLHDDWKQ